MLAGNAEKRVIFLVLCFIVYCSIVVGQNDTAVKRVFAGGGTIQAGRYEDFYLRVVAAEKIIYVDPGDTVEFMLYVRRGVTGDVAHSVEIIDDDNNFDLLVGPAVVPEVRVIDQIRVKASLTAKQDLVPGDYPLRIKVRGAEFVEESYPLDLIIRVGGTGRYWSISFLVISACLIGLITWRRFGVRHLA